MCPDKNLLSAFYDGELDPRFDVEVSAHVAACDSCSQFIGELEKLHSALAVEDKNQYPVDMAAAWNVLQKRTAVAFPSAVWNRGVNVPRPVLAFVALLVIVLSVGLFYSISSRNAYQPFDSVTRTHLEASELTTVEAILDYLDTLGQSRLSTFTLPVDTKLRFWSEPTLIRAADYQRGAH